MPARLIAMSGSLGGATIALSADEVTVGRDAANHVVLADPSVSPRHCVLVCRTHQVTLRDLDRGNPSFVNGLPAEDRPLADGDEIQIGGSLFVLRTLGGEDGDEAENREDVKDVAILDRVRGTEKPAPSPIVMRREDVFDDARIYRAASAERLWRDLAALIRIGAAFSAVRGLVALWRPLIELVADAVPADRGAVIPSFHGGTGGVSAVGWSRGATATRTVLVSQPIVDRVLGEAVGVLTTERSDSPANPDEPPAARSVLAAPLVGFDKPVGAIVLEADGADRFDEGHLRLVMAIAGIAATALEHARHVEWLEGENRRLKAELNLDHNMVGESASMRDIYRRIARVAPTDATVLVTGESGTGKELVARAIHRNSPRAARPFVAINCAAITETLLESELFGHEKGAFTGAIAQKKGKLEVAEGGTVFLDEIGELSPALQAKLLRVLQEREFERVGGTSNVRVDFRLIAATNRDLEGDVGSGAFRRDLYYRLNVVSLAMPSLKDRRDDIPMLASFFLRRHSDKSKRPLAGFSAEALACLAAYDWPGNVRELENAVEHALVLGSTGVILPDDLPDAVAEAGVSPSATAASADAGFHDAIKQAKKDVIVRAVEKAGGNYNAAARLLGLHPNYLHRLIKNLQLKAALKSPADRGGV